MMAQLFVSLPPLLPLPPLSPLPSKASSFCCRQCFFLPNSRFSSPRRRAVEPNFLRSFFSKKCFTTFAEPRDRVSTTALLQSPEPSDRFSVVIPTYNRLPILIKCLAALEEQEDLCLETAFEYEVVVVDDGSDDGTFEYLSENASAFPHVRLFQQSHGGATKARNLGVSVSRGNIIVFIDSDMVVAPGFLRSHLNGLKKAKERYGDDRAFTYGAVINTCNFENPKAEKFKITDYSAAFFATGNVAIYKRKLMEACLLLEDQSQGPFDADFSEYGWEDLELGERLRNLGAKIEHCPDAVGFHYHPSFTLDQLPHLIRQEKQRGRGGVTFFQKHPNLNVRLMVQLTPFHYGLWFFLTLGGYLNENRLRFLLQALVENGKPGIALGLLSPLLNWYTVTAAREKWKSVESK